MSLVLAIRNATSIVFATDTDVTDAKPGFSQCMLMPNKVVLLLAGNLEAVEQPIMSIKAELGMQVGAATVARLLHAQMAVTVAPNLDDFKGRIEMIVAGFDTEHHQPTPQIYYLDSAQNLLLMKPEAMYAAGGATAAVAGVMSTNPNLATATSEQLAALTKECMTATRLKWPDAVEAHVRMGTIMPESVQIQAF